MTKTRREFSPKFERDPAAMTVEPAAAMVVQEMFTSLIEDHASLFSLAKYLRALGVTSPTGRPLWSPTTLRSLLADSCYAGQISDGRPGARTPRLRHAGHCGPSPRSGR